MMSVEIYEDTVRLVPSAARTTSGSSQEFDVAKFRQVSITVDVTAVSGTSPTLDIYVEGKDVATGKYYTLYQFPQITAICTLNRCIGEGLETNKMLPEIIRIRWVIGGTTPSFTFQVGAFIK